MGVGSTAKTTSAFTKISMNYTKYEQTHVGEDYANMSHKEIRITVFIIFNMLDLF
jgi:hypothetical protein